MGRRGASTVGIALALVFAGTGPGARAEPMARFTYAAIYAPGLSELAPPTSTPSGQVAPTGWFRVVATGRSIALTIDDAVARDGSHVPVTLTSSRQRLRLCVPVRVADPVLTAPGEQILVVIGSLPSPCTSVATTGVVTVTGAR